MITIIINIVFILVIIYVLVEYIILLYNNPFSKKVKERINRNIITYLYEGNEFTIDLNKITTITNINVLNPYVKLPSKYNDKFIRVIKIEEKVICDTFEISDSIKRIDKLDLKCLNVISNNSLFEVKDDLILDYKKNILVIFKDKKEDELKDIACNYSFSRKALYYLTNAKYHQFVLYKKLYDIRFSKPYQDKNEELYAIVPKVIEGFKVESISINYAFVKYLNIDENIKRIIVEKKSEFEVLDINKENKIFRIFGKTLANKETGMFVSTPYGTFNKVGSTDKKQQEYKKLKKIKVENCKYLTNFKKMF